MNKIPVEILLEVFEYLDYWDLRQVPFICRRFQSLYPRIASKSSVSLALFRDLPTSTPPRITENDEPDADGRFPRFRPAPLPRLHFGWDSQYFYWSRPRDWENPYPVIPFPAGIKVHPCFEYLSHMPSYTLWDVGFEYDDGSYIPLHTTPAASENAITPAVGKLVLHVGFYPPIVVSASKTGRGVSVLDFVNGIVQVYDTPIAEDTTSAYSDYSPPGCTRANDMDFNNFYQWRGITEIKIHDGAVHVFVPTGMADFEDYSVFAGTEEWQAQLDAVARYGGKERIRRK